MSFTSVDERWRAAWASWARPLGAAALGLLLGACNYGGLPGLRGDLGVGAPNGRVEAGKLTETEQIGGGPTRVALIVPLTQASGPSAVGASLRNAAKLAHADSGANDVTILVRDDHSSAAGAQAAAQAALADGAEIIVGPVFAASVRETAKLARAAGRPVIAFSTDASVGGRGVYLLSFLVEDQVERLVDFAVQRGKKSIAALVPENDYGTVALAQLQASAASHGVRVLAIERYKPGAVAEPARRVAALGEQIDALFIPEQAEAMASVSRVLQAAGIDGKKAQILGVGLWNDPRILRLPALQGAWFVAPENQGYNALAQRYRAQFGQEPARIATLAYDAVSLAIALSRTQGSQRYSESVLTNPSGFNGADGVFRFKPDGVSQRGLSVLEISNGAAKVVSPAPRSFAGGA